jgi:hypothetical protein
VGFSVLHYSNPADHVLSGGHHGDPNSPSTYHVAFGIDHNISNSMGMANFTADWNANSGLDIPIGLVADEIMNSCRRKSVIGQVLQMVRHYATSYLPNINASDKPPNRRHMTDNHCSVMVMVSINYHKYSGANTDAKIAAFHNQSFFSSVNPNSSAQNIFLL